MSQALASRLLLPGLLVCVGTVSLYLSNGTWLSGDELFYSDLAQQLARAIIAAARSEPIDLAALADGVIYHGSFPPGMGMLLTPVQLVFAGDAPQYATRAYMTFVNLTLVWLIVREILLLGGSRRTAISCVLLPCAVPYYLFYLGMLWADLVGAHLALLALLRLERRLSHSASTDVLSSRHALGIGLLLAATALIRAQFVFLPAIALVRIALHALRSREHANTRKGSWALAGRASSLIIISFVVVLAPWNYVINERYGFTVMSTSPHLGPLLQDRDFVQSAKEEVGRNNPFHAVQEKILRDAHAAGRSLREQAYIEREKLPKKSAREERRAIRQSLNKFYFFENNRFLQRFFEIQTVPAKFSDTLGRGLLKLNSFSWWLLLSLGTLAFCAPAFPRKNDYSLPLSLKGIAFLLTCHPFFVLSHGRYYVALIPLFALLISMTIETGARGTLGEFNKHSLHDWWILAGQIFALLYGVAHLWIFLAY